MASKVSVQNLYDDLEPNAWQVRRNLDCSSTQPGHIRRDVHGTYNDTMEARASWLQCTASWIRSDLQPEVKQALRDCARSNGLHEKLDRAILVHDISVRLPTPFSLFGDLITVFHRHLPLQFERS